MFRPTFETLEKRVVVSADPIVDLIAPSDPARMQEAAQVEQMSLNFEEIKCTFRGGVNVGAGQIRGVVDGTSNTLMQRMVIMPDPGIVERRPGFSIAWGDGASARCGRTESVGKDEQVIVAPLPGYGTMGYAQYKLTDVLISSFQSTTRPFADGLSVTTSNILPYIEQGNLYLHAEKNQDIEVENDETHLAGDFNGDGTVDAADYVVWCSNRPLEDRTKFSGNRDARILASNEYFRNFSVD
jgi:hypothetical protein